MPRFPIIAYSDFSLEAGLLSVDVLSFFSFASFLSVFFVVEETSPEGDLWSVA